MVLSEVSFFCRKLLFASCQKEILLLQGVFVSKPGLPRAGVSLHSPVFDYVFSKLFTNLYGRLL